MTEKQTNKILLDFRNSIENLLTENEKTVGLLWLCLKEIFENLMFNDNTKMPKGSLSRREKKVHNFDNILANCHTTVRLCKNKDLENLLTAFGYMDAQLFQIQSDVQNARGKIKSIMKRISDKLPDEQN